MKSFRARLEDISPRIRQLVKEALDDESLGRCGENADTIALLLRLAIASGMTVASLAGALGRPVAEVQTWTIVGIEPGKFQFEVVETIEKLLVAMD